MTERDYQRLLDTVQAAIDTEPCDFAAWQPGDARCAANDNAVEWALVPFPEGWHASA